MNLASRDIERVEYFELTYLGKIARRRFRFVIIVVGEIGRLLWRGQDLVCFEEGEAKAFRRLNKIIG